MKKKVLLIILPILILALGYSVGAFVFNDTFLPNTYINDKNVGGMKVAEVENELQATVADNSLTIIRKDDTTEEIKLSDIDFTCKYKDSIQEIKDAQSPAKWLFAYFGEENYTIPISTKYDAEKLDEAISHLKCLTNEAIQDPVDAKIEKTQSGFVVVDAIDGNRLDESKTRALVKEAVNNGYTEINLAESNCYLTAKIKADDPSITSVMDKISKYNDLVITLDLVDAEEVINYSVFGDWLVVKDGNVTFSTDKVGDYATKLSIKYNTFGTTRDFYATDVGWIKVGGGANDSYGFQLAINATRDKIIDALYAGETTTIDAEWNIPALCRGAENGDIGDTYVEADLTRQHLWYYKDGELLMESDFVSGLDTDSRRTPTGAFRVWHKERNATLRGQGYATPVDYWMPFTWTGCGLHDASWKSAFGGQIYKTSGSHGCLNLPPAFAEKLYKEISYDTPVIVYNS